MNLTEIRAAIATELDDSGNVIFDTEMTDRAVVKVVSIMSRLIPKVAILETTLGGDVSDEALTISSSTGTTTHHPISPGSFSIDGETLDTDYTINYLTGVVTEIGALLADGAYVCDYKRDPRILDISTLLPEEDYIKIEKVECPVGNDPPTYVPFDVFGELLLVRGSGVGLAEDEHLRIIYQKPWTTPVAGTDGDYPEHLDNAVIMGACGQCLIFKAETYVQSAVSALSALTAPTLGTFAAPSAPTLPTAPTAPTAPTPSYTAATTALTAVSTEITAAKAHHTSGATVINVPTAGEGVAATYGAYADGILRAAGTRVQEALANLRHQEDVISLFASEVASYASEVNSYANEMSGTVGKYREQIASEGVDVAFNNAMIAKYVAQANEQEMKARNFLDIAGRYLASGQAKINEFLTMIGVKPELIQSRASSEQRS